MTLGTEVTEYAYQMSDGGHQIWNTAPYIEKIYPLAERIKAEVQNGKVYRRRIVVVEEWAEICPVGDPGRADPA